MKVNEAQNPSTQSGKAKQDSEVESAVSDATALLPCPFDGAKAFTSYDGDEAGESWSANCPDCSATIECFPREDTAIEAWNRRTSNPAIEELILAAKDALAFVDANGPLHARFRSRLRTAINNVEKR